MTIKEIISQNRNDFTAIMVCEHCEVESKNSNGYNDHYYHTRVIPGMHCKSCGKNRAGKLDPSREDKKEK